VVPWAFAKQLVRPLLRGRVLGIALIAGICDATANMCYVLATHAGLLSLASVLTSLYPAVTVILETGLGAESAEWAEVQRAVTRGTGSARASGSEIEGSSSASKTLVMDMMVWRPATFAALHPQEIAKITPGECR